ncbi:unnamed protein product, partial [Phaeothamnion confervicola]
GEATKIGAASAVQRLTLAAQTSTVTAGGYRLELNGALTDCIAHDATAAEVAAALAALPDVRGGVSVDGRVFVDDGHYYPVTEATAISENFAY